jgi:hypothetical protein
MSLPHRLRRPDRAGPELPDEHARRRAAHPSTSRRRPGPRRSSSAAHNEAVSRLGVGMLASARPPRPAWRLAIKASTEFGAKMAQLQSLSHANAATMQQLSTRR